MEERGNKREMGLRLILGLQLGNAALGSNFQNPEAFNSPHFLELGLG